MTGIRWIIMLRLKKNKLVNIVCNLFFIEDVKMKEVARGPL